MPPYRPFQYTSCSKDEILRFIDQNDFETLYGREITFNELKSHSCFDQFKRTHEGKDKYDIKDFCANHGSVISLFVWCIKTSDKTIYIEVVHDDWYQNVASRTNKFNKIYPTIMYSNLFGFKPYRILEVIDDVQLW